MAQESTLTTNTHPASQAKDVEFEQTSTIIEKVVDGVIGKALSHVDARTVYGDPVVQGDRTVIPVAKVSSGYGFGAGTGQGSDGEGNQKGAGGGGGGGGKIDAQAIGYVEVTPDKSTFVPIVDVSAVALRAITLFGIAAIVAVLAASRGGDQDD